MPTYNELIKANEDFANAHFKIKNFGNGERWNITTHNQQAEFKYPLMWMEDVPIPSTTGSFVWTWRVYFLDRVPSIKKRGDDLQYVNENETKSDMISCAKDLISFWVQDKIFPLTEAQKTFTITTIDDEIEDRLTGCFFDLKLDEAINYDACSVPMSGVVPPPADACDPATITINSTSVTFGTIASGATQNILVKNGVGAQVGSEVAGEWIVPTASPAAINSSDRYKTGVTLSTNSGDDGDLERGNGTSFFILSHTNPLFSEHSNRQTGTDGGYYDHVSGDYKDKDGVITTQALAFPDDLVLDFASYDQLTESVLMIRFSMLPATNNIQAKILAAPYTVGSFTGFFVLNFSEMILPFNGGVLDAFLNYPPFDFVGSGVPGRVASSSSNGTSYISYIGGSQVNKIGQTTTCVALIGRYITKTQLGL